jgi:phage shock protein B
MDLDAIIIVPTVVIGLPWLIMHYITKWKTAATLTNDDEQILGNMNDLARRLEDRLETIERLVAADNPDFKTRRLGRSTQDIDAENTRKLERNI